MKKITPVSQSGFDIVVRFTLDDGSVREERLSLRPFKVGEDEYGADVMRDPSDDVVAFLKGYGEALENGIRVEAGPALDPALFGNDIEP